MGEELQNKIVLISGKQGSGKTTLAKNLEKLADEAGYHVLRMRFAELLYAFHDYIWRQMEGYGYQKPGVKDGRLLQLLGTEWGRTTISPTVWTDIGRKRADQFIGQFTSNSFVVIEDARFPTEFDAFPDAYRVRLEAPAEVRQMRCEAWRKDEFHESEVALDAYSNEGRFDLRVLTTGTEPVGCAQSVLDFVMQWKGRQ